jgi:serine/threonine protein phosphatase PrpC
MIPPVLALLGGRLAVREQHTLETTIAHRTGVTFEWAALTDRGKLRKLNEDNYLDRPGVFVVADGMGGHAAGDVASGLVVRRFEEFVEHVPITVSSVAPMIIELNGEIREEARRSGQGGMGTTLVAALWVDHGEEDGMVIVNVGDSRCYLVDDQGFRRLTHDHSVVQELVDAGSITEAEADRHPDRHIVTRAMGVDEAVFPDFFRLSRSIRQRLLLCTDGVTGEINDVRLAEIMSADISPATAVSTVLDEVLSGSAKDNATIVVIDVGWVDVPDAGDAEVTGARDQRVDVDVTAERPQRRESPTAEPIDRKMPLISEVPR